MKILSLIILLSCSNGFAQSSAPQAIDGIMAMPECSQSEISAKIRAIDGIAQPVPTNPDPNKKVDKSSLAIFKIAVKAKNNALLKLAAKLKKAPFSCDQKQAEKSQKKVDRKNK
jgi:hypothetical protein